MENTNTAQVMVEEEITDILMYIARCHESIGENNYLTDSRFIPVDLINKYELGYDKNENTIIFPIDEGSYIKRFIDWEPEADMPKYAFNKGANNTVFNLNLLKNTDIPIFMTEGICDALSIEAAYTDARCIAINSANPRDSILDILKAHPRKVPLILALDTDEAGRDGTEKFKNKLEKAYIPYIEADLAGEYKDCNEAWVADNKTGTDYFTKRVHEALEKASNYVYPEQPSPESNDEFVFITTSEYMSQFLENIQRRSTSPAIYTGFKSLDNLLEGGLHAEELVILGAGSSMGKTTFVLQIADFIAQNRPVMFFSLETSRDIIIAKSISRITAELDDGSPKRNAKTINGIYYGEQEKAYSKEEKVLVTKAMYAYEKKVKHLQIITGYEFRNVNNILEKVASYVQKTGQSPIVVCDYLQLLHNGNFGGTDKQVIDNAVGHLKEIAVKYSVPVIATSSINRAGYGKEMDFSAYSGSSGIEFNADIALGLNFQNPDQEQEEKRKTPREILLSVLKNRNGALNGEGIPFDYYAQFNWFVETATPSAEGNGGGTSTKTLKKKAPRTLKRKP